mmetsp:Transcript_17182/g.48299  ORF Transcript_17182/g.48299 Transcript_17182/m.48299 type:complete len:213 (+) Transcript_17182:1017-1655(+)
MGLAALADGSAFGFHVFWIAFAFPTCRPDGAIFMRVDANFIHAELILLSDGCGHVRSSILNHFFDLFGGGTGQELALETLGFAQITSSSQLFIRVVIVGAHVAALGAVFQHPRWIGLAFTAPRPWLALLILILAFVALLAAPSAVRQHPQRILLAFASFSPDGTAFFVFIVTSDDDLLAVNQLVSCVFVIVIVIFFFIIIIVVVVIIVDAIG